MHGGVKWWMEEVDVVIWTMVEKMRRGGDTTLACRHLVVVLQKNGNERGGKKTSGSRRAMAVRVLLGWGKERRVWVSVGRRERTHRQ